MRGVENAVEVDVVLASVYVALAGAQAGLQLDGSSLEGRRLRVALSDPSRRNTPSQAKLPPAQAHGAASRGRGKSMLTLVPRAVKKGGAENKPPPKRPAFAGASKPDAGNGASGAEGGAPKDGAAPAGGGGAAKKDNDFFRNLFSKGSNL